MSTHGSRSGVAVQAGRLVEWRGRTVDLATGAAVSVRTTATSEAAARAWVPTLGAGCLDTWLTQDWLGRWLVRRIETTSPAPHIVMSDRLAWPHIPDGAVGATRVPGCGAWLAVAAAARREGCVPIHVRALPYLTLIDAAAMPPLAVCASAGGPLPPALEAWVTRGGRVALLVGAPDIAHRGRATLASARGPDVRLLRRAWARLARAPLFPSAAWTFPSHGGRDAMTHLELLDVSTRIEDARRDEDAIRLACEAVRTHARAEHAAVLVARRDGVEVLASAGPPRDSTLAWRQLCRPDAPKELVATSGFHAVARHGDDEATMWVAGRWPSREAGAGLAELLTVFARLIAPRVPRLASATPDVPLLERMLVGTSTMMQDVRAQIALAARAPFPVLIRGESGCGKELAARAIHALGPRRHRRCATINCAALPDELIESELFGHVRGAFTGAGVDRAGLFDEADGGTLFLDEVGELGVRAQAKLLRVLQDGEIRRVGENHARRVDVRVIAATNVSLEEAVRDGRFRADLFYRLDVVRVRMPALRERREDIPELAQRFWQECASRVGSHARLDRRVLDVLTRHDWPGNVRQLQNTLAAMAVGVPLRGRVTLDDLPAEIRHAACAGTATRSVGGLEAARREFEATYVREALTRAGGRPSRAARDLGLTRQGLSKLVRRLGLEPEP